MILENPVFKHKHIIEEACKTDEMLLELSCKKLILEIFGGSSEIIKPKIEIKEDYNMPEWIKCKHRIRRYEEGLGVQSYCLHPLNPLFTEVGLYLVTCNERECRLEKFYEVVE